MGVVTAAGHAAGRPRPGLVFKGCRPHVAQKPPLQRAGAQQRGFQRTQQVRQMLVRSSFKQTVYARWMLCGK